MSLSDKIKQLLADKALSPSIFADEIGIQRSSVSHILAGRNKPSLEMVQKIVKRFPELGLDWILDENSLPPSSTEPAILKTKKQLADNTDSAKLKEAAEPTRPELRRAEKKIDRIVIFYTDGTFAQFQENAV
jgi:transcriptional regulator with XRE-family HTH domain